MGGCKPRMYRFLVKQDKSVFASKQDQMSALIVKVKDALTEVQANLNQQGGSKAHMTALQTLH